MFASQLIGPVAETALQDRQREHAAERRVAQAREANAGGGGISGESATLTWLASIYLPPSAPVARTHRQDRICRRRNTIAAGLSWASEATTWLSRIVNWLSDRRAPTATP
jgi:hypothetical protein